MVDADFSGGGIIETDQQVDQCSLAGSGGADDGQRFSDIYMEGDVL